MYDDQTKEVEQLELEKIAYFNSRNIADVQIEQEKAQQLARFKRELGAERKRQNHHEQYVKEYNDTFESVFEIIQEGKTNIKTDESSRQLSPEQRDGSIDLVIDQQKLHQEEVSQESFQESPYIKLEEQATHEAQLQSQAETFEESKKSNKNKKNKKKKKASKAFGGDEADILGNFSAKGSSKKDKTSKKEEKLKAKEDAKEDIVGAFKDLYEIFLSLYYFFAGRR